MLSLTGMLCRFWRGALCGVARKEPQEETAKEAPGENKAADLTVIRGIGIVTQNQLYKAGIKTYAALAGAQPEELREVLGDVARGAKIERWITQARELAGKGTT